jgi:fatty-acyl-CoA synthase
MLGKMMQQPLLISALLRHAERHHHDTQIVSRTVEGGLHRCTYADLAERSRRLANALAALGVGPSDRIATLAWNGYRHMELYYGVSGAGAIVHTVNPRLHPDQVAWILDHAQDKVLFFDLTFLPLVAQVASRLKTVRHLVVMTDRGHMPTGAQPELLCYEDLLAAASPRLDWPTFDENTASCLCYTSGTTGHPKGVLYTHRSTVLHSFAVALPDAMDCSAADTILPVVPMFHVNAWGLPYAACMVGAKLVLPGPHLDGRSLYELFEAEQVTTASGVPTIWQGLLDHIAAQGRRFSSLRRTGIGGSACPPSMIATFEQLGVNVMHGWGMTETSPVVTTGMPKSRHGHLALEALVRLKSRQGRAAFGTDITVVDDTGVPLPWDGRAAGELRVRGHWVASGYYGTDVPATVDGWFPTGDVATIDADGYLGITDRIKDVIKSGGEWISSIDIENIAMGHPAVALASCIAEPHDKWVERPLLVVVPRPTALVTEAELLAFFEGKIAKWWTPDRVVFVESIPLGPTGKVQKNKLRAALLQEASACKS